MKKTKCSIPDRLKLFWMTVKDVTLHFLKYGKVMDRTRLSKVRIEVCELCTHCQEDNKQCDICGCYMKIKTRLIASKCPIGKW